MEAAEARAAPDLLRQVTLPVALLVAVAVAAAWYVTWATSGLTMSLMMVPTGLAGTADVAAFFALMVVMMVAMMLPSALPMIVAYHGMTRLEAGRPTKPADAVGTGLFVLAYWLVWGAFAVLALFGLLAVGLLGPLTGALAIVPSAVLLAAGGYQFTRTKAACLGHCESPVGFMLHHWRSGRSGAFRMGIRHAAYCVGCCWLFMVVLFVVGAMSLPWMGAVSVAIFAEKVGRRPRLVARAIGVVFLAIGVLFAARLLA